MLEIRIEHTVSVRKEGPLVRYLPTTLAHAGTASCKRRTPCDPVVVQPMHESIEAEHSDRLCWHCSNFALLSRCFP
jgi:hypothetical protein